MQSNVKRLASVEAREALLRVTARVCLLGAGSGWGPAPSSASLGPAVASCKEKLIQVTQNFPRKLLVLQLHASPQVVPKRYCNS